MEIIAIIRDNRINQDREVYFPTTLASVRRLFGLAEDEELYYEIVDSNTNLIKANDDIKLISAFAELVEGVDEDLVKAVHEVTGYNARDFVSSNFSFEDCSLLYDVTTKRDLGEYWIDAIGGIQNLPKEQQAMYFDYEAYGRDIDIDAQGGFSSYGYVEINL
ncbi:TPA: antirestriction protein ArdA [Streptococcus pyogenes]|nr:antirestriction protein ArdA [Streptococcus pyogenes]